MGNTYIPYVLPISYLSRKSGECAQIKVAFTHTHLNLETKIGILLLNMKIIKRSADLKKNCTVLRL